MIRSQEIVVAIGSHGVHGLLWSTSFRRAKVERTRFASSTDELLSELPSDAPVTVVLPGHLFMVRTVTLPFADPRIIRKTLPPELEGTLPLPVDELLVDHVLANPLGDTGSLVFAIALPRKTAADCLTLFPEDRRPVRIIPDFVGLLSIARRLRHEPGACRILHVDDDVASLVVMAEGRPLVMRSTTHDGDWSSIGPWVEATLKPLERQDTEVDTLYVTGAAAGHAAPLLERTARIAPLPAIVNGISGDEWPAWAAVAGGALSTSEFPDFNAFGIAPDDGRFVRALRILTVGMGIVLVLGSVDAYVRYTTASRTVAALKAESRRVFSSVMPHVRNVVKEDVQLKVALATERQTRETLLGTSSPSYLAITRGLARLGIEHPGLKLREVAIEAGTLTVTGEERGVETDGLKALFSGIEGAREAQVEELLQGVEPNTYRFRVKVRVR